MQTYSCSGTLGDTYINLCILYRITKREPIVCNHYTVHTNWHKLIKQIYSLIPNIQVKFVNQRDIVNPRIYSAFVPHQKLGKALSSPSDWCVFPQFAFPRLACLPTDYTVLNPQSGRSDQHRILTQRIINETIESSQYPVVILGTEPVAEQVEGDNVINLTNRTSILEAMGIVSQARRIVTFQGIMSMVAASHRIQSNVYIRRIGDPHYGDRVAPEWAPYHTIQEERL